MWTETMQFCVKTAGYFNHNCNMSTYFSETRQCNVMNNDSFVLEVYTDGRAETAELTFLFCKNFLLGTGQKTC